MRQTNIFEFIKNADNKRDKSEERGAETGGVDFVGSAPRGNHNSGRPKPGMERVVLDISPAGIHEYDGNPRDLR